MKNRFLLLITFCYSINMFSQQLNDSWQIGIGMGITKFSESDAISIGDKDMFQIPVLSLTMPIGKKLSIDGAMSFNTIDDLGFISNSTKYFSMDAALRYNFNALSQKFSPYFFIGGSIVDTGKKMSPTFNIGAGGIYWVTNKIGVNPQINYKHSLESYESMKSHIQGTIGVVFKLNWNNVSKGSGYRNIKNSMSCM